MRQLQIDGVVDAMTGREGAGFLVRRPFPTGLVDHFGPFLLLDEMGPVDNAPGEAKGAPDHPHRGFETVTYVLEGELEHKDSVGNAGIITPGDVQWMTAGAGIVHSEMPTAQILREGGRTHGFQLWVNLPQKAKMHRPRYQDLTAAEMPRVDLDGGWAVIVAGEAYGTRGQAATFLPVDYLHLHVDPEHGVPIEVPGGKIAFVYVFGGDGVLGVDTIRKGQMATFSEGGGAIGLRAGSAGVDAIIGIAEPLPEPVVRYGPFVMNTRAEIIQAMEDYQAGRMGSIEPEVL